MLNWLPEIQSGSYFSTLVCVLLVIWIPFYAFWQLYRLGSLISKRLKFLLILFRTLLAFVLFLILLNLRFVFYQPDEDAFTYAVLIDNSGSMNVRDLEDKTRLEFANEKILGNNGLVKQIRQKYQVLPFVFEEKTTSLPDNQLLVTTSKQTDIDKALLYLTERIPSHSFGGVLLVTDGNDNVDEGMMRAATHYQDLGVPISLIGTGSHEKRGDISLAVKNSPGKLERGEEGVITVKLSRMRILPNESVVTLRQPDDTVLEQKVEWGSDETEKEISFRVHSYRSGKVHYQVQTPLLANEMDVTNNSQSIAVEITEPKVWKILYLGYALNWEFTFLDRLLKNSEQFQLHAVVQKDAKNFYISGLEEGVKEFPDFQILKHYQALLVDLNATVQMNEVQVKALQEYIQRVGGSILFLGPYVQSKPLPGMITELMPITLGEVTSYRGKREMQIKNPLLFGDSSNENDLVWLKSLFMPEEQFVQRSKDLKLGTQKFISVAGDDNAVFSAHYYGSGKVGFLALDSTWKWVMDSDRGVKNYLKFWTQILQWQTASAKDPLVVTPNLERFERNQSISIQADLLDEKFLPTDDAIVTISIIEPGEKASNKFTMDHDSFEKGRYKKELYLSNVGEYRYEVNATLNVQENGKTLIRSQKGKIDVTEVGQESGDSNLKEDLLEDLARVTQGKYWHYSNLPKPQDLPLAKNIKMKTTIKEWNRGFFLIILSITLLLTDIYLRRKNGLK